ncbi:MAG: 4-hydroxybenzoate octaprenyltransferase [Pseudomonadota bacterium]
MQDRLYQYLLLTRMHRPIGSFLLLWPTFWALWIAAEGKPDIWVTVVFFLGVLLMRSAGCVINDYADRNVDGHVKRTRERPLATGKVTPGEALILFAVLMLASFLLVLTMNWLTIQLAFIGAALAFIYPFMKRYTHFPQVVLGMAFSWGIPMAWAAQTDELSIVAWWIFALNLVWTVAYDTMYAMADREDDIKIGVKSTAVLFGQADKAIVGALQVIVLLMLWLLGQHLQLGWPYLVGLLAATMLFMYQQWLIREREPDACFQAFLNNNLLGAVVFGGVFFSYY